LLGHLTTLAPGPSDPPVRDSASDSCKLRQFRIFETEDLEAYFVHLKLIWIATVYHERVGADT